MPSNVVKITKDFLGLLEVENDWRENMDFSWEEIAEQHASHVRELEAEVSDLESEIGDLEQRVSEMYCEMSDKDEEFFALEDGIMSLLTDIVDRHPEGLKNGEFEWSCPHLKNLATLIAFVYVPKESRVSQPSRPASFDS